MLIKIVHIAAVLSLASLLSACQSTQAPPQKQQHNTKHTANHAVKSTETPRSTDGVQDITWQITHIQQKRANFFNQLPAIRLNSTLNTVNGHTGCNPVFGRYLYNFSQSRLSFDVKADHQVCDRALVQEANLMDALQRIVSFKRQGNELLLLDKEQNVLIVAQRK